MCIHMVSKNRSIPLSNYPSDGLLVQWCSDQINDCWWGYLMICPWILWFGQQKERIWANKMGIQPMNLLEPTIVTRGRAHDCPHRWLSHHLFRSWVSHEAPSRRFGWLEHALFVPIFVQSQCKYPVYLLYLIPYLDILRSSSILSFTLGSPRFISNNDFTLWWTNIAMERSTIFNGKIHYKWPFSIAMLVHQRVKNISKPEFETSESSLPDT